MLKGIFVALYKRLYPVSGQILKMAGYLAQPYIKSLALELGCVWRWCMESSQGAYEAWRGILYQKYIFFSSKATLFVIIFVCQSLMIAWPYFFYRIHIIHFTIAFHSTFLFSLCFLPLFSLFSSLYSSFTVPWRLAYNFKQLLCYRT